MKQFLSSIFCFYLGIQILSAQAQPKLIHDIQTEASGIPYFISELSKDANENIYYFTSMVALSSSYNGIFKYDGIGDKATLVCDIGFNIIHAVADIGIYYAIPDPNGVVNKWFIYYNDGTHGNSVFIDEVSTPGFEMETFHNDLYYRKSQAGSGLELWKSGPSTGSQVLLKDCLTGTGSSAPKSFYKGDSLLYFLAYASGIKSLLWRTDGSTDGTFALTASTDNISYYLDLKEVNGNLYFRTGHLPTKTQLWKTDGTLSGTSVVKVFPDYHQFFLSTPYSVAQKYMFQMEESGLGTEWWVSDGTESGTHLLKDIGAGANDANIGTNQYMTIENGNKFLFFTRNENDAGVKLWQTDGTSNGTISLVSFPDQLGISSFYPLGGIGDKCYFLFLNDDHTLNLWASDGTQNGTSYIKEILTDKSDFSSIFINTLPGQLFFDLSIQPSGGSSPSDQICFFFRTDGTPEGTYQVNNVASTAFRHSEPLGFTESTTGSVLFRASPIRTYEHLIYEYQPNGSTNLQNIGSDQPDYYTSPPYTTGDKTFWFSNDSTLKSLHPDGSITSIKTVKTANWSQKVGFKGKFYFINYIGYQIWVSDGTPNGTMILAETTPSRFTSLYASSDSLFWLSSNNQQNTIALWRSDGTIEGTTFTPNPFPYTSGSVPTLNIRNERPQLVGFDYLNDTIHVVTQGFPDLAFKAKNYDNIGGTEIIGNTIYIVDAPILNANQVATFRLVKGLNGSSEILHTFKKIVGYQEFYYNEFFISDHLHAIHNTLLLGAGEQSNNTEPWISDGTVDGTVMLKDINPNGSSDPQNFIRYDDDRWLFTAFDGQHTGWWATDGTTDGTFHIANLPQNGPANVLPAPNYPYLLQKKTLFFSMNDGLTGQEPWMLELGDSLVSGVFRTITPLQNSITISPNPASDHLMVGLKGMESRNSITFDILNLQGQVVQSGVLDTSSGLIQLKATLPSGCYYLRLLDIGSVGSVGRFCKG